MKRYFFHLAYNGTPFHGWQRQPNANSVQQEIEKALSTILQVVTPIVGCGRTDTGVHARSFYAHVELNEEVDVALLQHKLNTLLPESISIFGVKEVSVESHARFTAVGRSYEYLITSWKDPFLENRAYRFTVDLNVEAMNKAAAILLDYEDFGSFCKAKADNQTDRCNVIKAEWRKEGHLLVFEIKADRFLRNMVRAIVGTLLEVGQEKIAPEEMHVILKKNDRTAAGRSVPAHGLYLTQVEYPKNTFL